MTGKLNKDIQPFLRKYLLIRLSNEPPQLFKSYTVNGMVVILKVLPFIQDDDIDSQVVQGVLLFRLRDHSDVDRTSSFSA